ncbi:MAG: PD40 domain-containing protein [Planctomycetes bacterium]|nr:PD40 domain-containing protein [Planctomycetota bacterium]
MGRLVALSAAMLVIWSVGNTQSPKVVMAQESAVLAEKLEVGTLRRTSETVEFASTVTYSPGKDWATDNRFGFTIHRDVDEWITGMDGSRVTQLWRSYGAIMRKNMQVLDMGKGPEEMITDGQDWKANVSFVLAVAADGSRSLAVKPSALIDAENQGAACGERQPVIAHGKSVSVGDSFKLQPAQIGILGGFSASDVIKSHDITATVSGMNMARDEGLTVKLKLAIKFTHFTEQINEFDDASSTRYTTESTLSGEAVFNATEGRMVSLGWSGTLKAKGKLSGADIEANATLKESYTYSYGKVIDAKPDNGSAGPEKGETGKVLGEKFRALEEHEIVIGRNNGKVTRLQAFDTKTKKVVKNLLTLWEGTTVSQIAVSPDRKRVAFSSNLNSGICSFERDVFVLELESGTVNQISPRWADNKGIAQPLKSEQTCTLKGRIVWYDDDPMGGRDRNDGFTGSIIVDHTVCRGVINSDGTFSLAGVPVGHSLYVDIQGTLPLIYRNGKTRGENDVMKRWAGAGSVILPTEGGVYDMGDVRINSHRTRQALGRPTWRGGEIWHVYDGWNSAMAVGYPEHTFAEHKFGEALDMMNGGFACSPNGKMFAFTANGSHVGVWGPDGKLIKSIANAAFEPAYNSEGAWTSDNAYFCYSCWTNATMGESVYGAPGIGVATIETGGAGGRRWMQLAGQSCQSMALDAKAYVAYCVMYRPDGNVTYGELWAWDSRTDSMERLTSLGDVVAVGSYGR